MSQAYLLRRDGRDYQAPNLDTMRQWARDGRVLPSDMVYSPKYQSWYRARDLRELRDVLPQVGVKPPPATATPPPVRPAQQFWLRKGEQNYAADNLETILRWASEGNISPDDFIYHPSYGKWFRAGDSPQLASRFPAHVARRPPFLPPGEDPLGRSRGAAAARSVEAIVSPVPVSPAVTSASPVAEQPIERADSTARTVMDFRAADIERAIRKRQEASALHPGGGGGVRKVEAPRSPAGFQQGARIPTSAKRRLTLPGSAAPQMGMGSVERAKPPPPPPGATDEPSDLPLPEAKPAVPVPPEIVKPTAQTLEGPIDEDARFYDELGLMKLFYDVARVHMVTRDLRPGELLEAACDLPSTGDSFLGLAKRAIYHRLQQRMREHIDSTVLGAAEKISPENQPGFRLFLHRAQELAQTYLEADEVVGSKPPERVVVGNVGRPKMSPDEEAVLIRIDEALKALISVRSKTPLGSAA